MVLNSEPLITGYYLQALKWSDMPTFSVNFIGWLVCVWAFSQITLAAGLINEEEINKKWGAYEDLSLVDAASALVKVQQSYELLPATASKYEQVMANLAVITIQMRLNQLPEALKNINRAYAISIQTENHRYTGELLARKGQILLRTQDLDPALRAVEQALEVFESIDDRPLIGVSYNLRGQILLALGNKAGALDDLLKSYEIVKAANDATKTASALSAIANIYESNSKFDKAVEYFELSLNYLDHNKQKLYVSILKYNIGRANIKLNKLAEAEKYLTDAISLNETLGDQVGAATSRLQLAKVFELEGHSDDAIKLYREILPVFEEINAIRRKFIIYVSLARLFGKSKKNNMAVRYVKNAESELPDVKTLETKLEFHRVAADIYSHKNNHKNSSEALRKYISLLKKKFENDHDERFNQLHVQFNTEQKEVKNKLLEQENAYKSELIIQKEFQHKLLYTIVVLILVFSVVLSLGLIKQIKMKHQFALLALTDELTKALNRRAILENAEVKLQLFHKNKQPLVFAIIDLDKFKVVNDTYGHHVGDEVLKAFYKFAKQAIREPDEIGRLGGEEWLLMLPNMKLDQVDCLFNRIKKNVSDLSISGIDTPHSICFSMGLAIAAENDFTLENIMKKADVSVYKAKDSGRDCWIV